MRFLSLTAVTLVAALTAAAAAAPRDDRRSDQQVYDRCAVACDSCKRACDMCGVHCSNLVAQGHKEHMETVRTCQDCSTLCAAASNIVAKRGPFSDLVCTACAEACKRCGDACQRHAQHDEVMKKCAEECHQCEQACRAMLHHSGR